MLHVRRTRTGGAFDPNEKKSRRELLAGAAGAAGSARGAGGGERARAEATQGPAIPGRRRPTRETARQRHGHPEHRSVRQRPRGAGVGTGTRPSSAPAEPPTARGRAGHAGAGHQRSSGVSDGDAAVSVAGDGGVRRRPRRDRPGPEVVRASRELGPRASSRRQGIGDGAGSGVEGTGGDGMARALRERVGIVDGVGVIGTGTGTGAGNEGLGGNDRPGVYGFGGQIAGTGVVGPGRLTQ